MKGVLKLYHFLGSIHFAIILIAMVTLLTIFGTFIESKTESHQYAASLTYGNPLFIWILWCFFLNILISSLRRWPFKKRHIPFLITHLGLLMILGAALAKSYYGVQGAMGVLEGGSAFQILEDGKNSLLVENRDGRQKQFELTKSFFSQKFRWDDLQLELLEIAPHSEEKLETWAKGNQFFLWGYPPFHVYPWKDERQFIKSGTAFLDSGKQPWDIYAFRTSEPEKLLEHFQPERVPALVFIDDSKNTHYLATFLQTGKTVQLFSSNSIDAINVYDRGFGGYTVQANLPTGKLKESEAIAMLAEELRQEIATNPAPLAPPLELMRKACNQCQFDFAETCISFLFEWSKTDSWLFPEEGSLSPKLTTLFQSLKLSQEILKACYWSSFIFNKVEPELAKGKNLLDILKETEWPLIDSLKKTENSSEELLTMITLQIFSASPLLPEPEAKELDSLTTAHLFSAYLRTFGIHFKSFVIDNSDLPQEIISIETPLTAVRKVLDPQKKWEDNLPRITLKSKEGDCFCLSYDRQAQGLKWPILYGKYLVRFQPKITDLPYKVRLRKARQINYPGTNQPYSFESDLIFTDRRTGKEVEKTISMNNVHETWDGYRFYLSNIGTEEGNANQIQIVVNRDPAKYWLLYPGAFILTLGIIFLFWRR